MYFLRGFLFLFSIFSLSLRSDDDILRTETSQLQLFSFVALLFVFCALVGSWFWFQFQAQPPACRVGRVQRAVRLATSRVLAKYKRLARLGQHAKGHAVLVWCLCFRNALVQVSLFPLPLVGMTKISGPGASQDVIALSLSIYK